MRASDGVLAAAGLIGAGGVAAAAASAHVTGGGPLAQAAEILMIHAAAVVALVALARTPARGAGLMIALAGVMALAAALFGADIAMLVFAGRHLFPMAAPIGGSILIGGWLMLAGLALAARIGRA
ncbi:DUF423 domain-containing protein [Siculibacillus lacustris]|uniref:DUF423 domain-containing protein n=2 Tax=Siculibacillus lacustris TaxID=1549641 RepID=A0A4V2KU53_9HYPH|nr:DUF423 domain-containing protein [Siculibacillus lacustris]